MTGTEAIEAEAKVLDTRGLLCPYPYIQARQALESLPPGSRIEILTDSEATAMSSVPILCEQQGYAFTRAKDGDQWRLVVTKP
jgi:TusA-related sulfurtransferase